MKTDITTRKDALSNTVGLIFKKAGERRLTAAEKRENSAELRSINQAELAIKREKRLAKTADANEKLRIREKALQERKATLAEKKHGLAVQNAVTSTFKMYIGAMPDQFKPAMAIALSKNLQDTQSFGKISKNITPAETMQFSNQLFKTTLDNLVKKHPEMALAAQGYEIPQDSDYAIKTVRVDEPVIGTDGKPVLEDGKPVTRQIERLVRMNVNEVVGVDRGPDGEVLIDPDTNQPIAKTFAPGTQRIVLDKGTGKVLAQGNGDAGWTGGSKVEMVDGVLTEFKGTINRRPFIDASGKFWKQGANFTKIPGDLGEPVEKAKQYAFIRTDPNTGFTSVFTGTEKEAGSAATMIGKALAGDKLRTDTNEVVALSRNWSQLSEMVNINHRAILAANNLTTLQGVILKASDYLLGFTGDRPEFERIIDKLGLFKNFGTGPGKQQATLGGNNIKNKGGLNNYLNDVLNKKYVESLKGQELEAADGSIRSLRTEELSALQGLATMRAEAKSMVFNLAYALARTNEPGGRLTDRDIANALMMMGVTEDGSFRPREMTNAMNRQVANRQAGIVDQYISHTLTDIGNMEKAGKVDEGDRARITKQSIFGAYGVPVFEPPKRRRFEADDARSTGDITLNQAVGQRVAKDYPSYTVGIYAPLYDADTQTWDRDAVFLELDTIMEMLVDDPENTLLQQKKQDLGEIIKRLRPEQAAN